MQWATTDSTRKKSVESLERAANWGWPEAQNLLADCLATGKGVEIDRVAAEKWYRSAAERHHAPAELELAEAFFGANERLTVTPNKEEGMQWLTRAADDGDSYAQFILGAQSLAETGPHRNIEKARSLLSVATKNGSAGARITLKALGESATPEKR